MHLSSTQKGYKLMQIYIPELGFSSQDFGSKYHNLYSTTPCLMRPIFRTPFNGRYRQVWLYMYQSYYICISIIASNENVIYQSCSPHDIAEILLKLALNINQSTNQSINQPKEINSLVWSVVVLYLPMVYKFFLFIKTHVIQI
jgi:hypothetical protein